MHIPYSIFLHQSCQNCFVFCFFHTCCHVRYASLKTQHTTSSLSNKARHAYTKTCTNNWSYIDILLFDSWTLIFAISWSLFSFEHGLSGEGSALLFRGDGVTITGDNVVNLFNCSQYWNSEARSKITPGKWLRKLNMLGFYFVNAYTCPQSQRSVTPPMLIHRSFRFLIRLCFRDAFFSFGFFVFFSSHRRFGFCPFVHMALLLERNKRRFMCLYFFSCVPFFALVTLFEVCVEM